MVEMTQAELEAQITEAVQEILAFVEEQADTELGITQQEQDEDNAHLMAVAAAVQNGKLKWQDAFDWLWTNEFLDYDEDAAIAVHQVFLAGFRVRPEQDPTEFARVAVEILQGEPTQAGLLELLEVIRLDIEYNEDPISQGLAMAAMAHTLELVP